MELKMGLTPADFAIPRLEIGSKYNLPLARLKNNLEMGLKDQATIHRVSSIFVNLVFEPIDTSNLVVLAAQVEEWNQEHDSDQQIDLGLLKPASKWQSKQFDSTEVKILPDFDQPLLQIKSYTEPEYEKENFCRKIKFAEGLPVLKHVDGKPIPLHRLSFWKLYDVSQTTARDLWRRIQKPKTFVPSLPQVEAFYQQLLRVLEIEEAEALSRDPADAFFDASYRLFRRHKGRGHAEAAALANGLAVLYGLHEHLRLPLWREGPGLDVRQLHQARCDVKAIRKACPPEDFFGGEKVRKITLK